jgi:long-chain-fatty-acid--[acyl-carrier-protein] ligase
MPICPAGSTASPSSPTTRTATLGLDSLDRMELSLQVERQFGFTGDEACETVGQLLALAEGRATRKPPQPAPSEWSAAPRPAAAPSLHGDTILATFIENALAHRKDVVVADDLVGAMTGERLLVAALTLARRLRAVAGSHVGVLLPASAACDIVLLALHFAGKVPVVLNWTTGPGNLAHAARALALSHVVTSRAFADRVGVAVEGADYLFLEDLRLATGKRELLRTLFRVRWLPGSVRRAVPAVPADRPAVVLFTSGSEKAPKAVPLTHTNLLSCQRGIMAVMGVTRADVILGFLPAFHSFGLTVTTLLPLQTGLRVVHSPDPTDAANLVHKIRAYGVTVLAGTPTFVSYILERAALGSLAGLRLVVVGAEKCPPALFESVAAVPLPVAVAT